MGAALGPGEAAELAALRQRAYGPDPDLDAVALARLQALEDAAHGVAGPDEPVAAAVGPAVARAPAEPVDTRLSRDVPDPQTSAPGRSGSGRGHRIRGLRHRGWWLAGAAAVAAVLVVWGATQLAQPDSDVVLTRIPPGEEGQAFARSSFLDNNDFDIRALDRFEPYGRLQVWVATSTTGDECLLIDADGYGIVGVSCTPRGLDPIVDVRIWRGMRNDVFGDLPVNTVLRFLYTGERVHLWVRSPAE